MASHTKGRHEWNAVMKKHSWLGFHIGLILSCFLHGYGVGEETTTARQKIAQQAPPISTPSRGRVWQWVEGPSFLEPGHPH